MKKKALLLWKNKTFSPNMKQFKKSEKEPTLQFINAKIFWLMNFLQ